MAIPFSDEDLVPAVTHSLEKIKPTLALDGGGIKFIAVKNGIVYVQLQAACVGCASSGTTIKYSVERQMQIDIHPEIKVINVPLGLEDSLETLEYNIYRA
jgi:Fe-S cluster biogenesis protein NfuA